MTETKTEERQVDEPAEIPAVPETGFRDVSEAADALSEDPGDAAALAVINAEMSHRATAQANGGGPWPQDVLVERFTGDGAPAVATLPEYTSHEDEGAGRKSSRQAKK
jgi:hypothetical protein